MMKRKGDDLEYGPGEHPTKQRAVGRDPASEFRSDLFDAKTLELYRSEYASSTPYKHGVIKELFDPQLLRNVREEIQSNLSFTAKETDIYKIYQSGDLANLDGLEDSSLRLLPSLVTLRNALYSHPFRKYISSIARSGPLSGRKTDMAVNVYTPGCHLLCHDDVIGSRRVSYILYLTDPDRPWKAAWGGALRLYPTDTFSDANDTESKVPSPEFSVSIPPAFNQLAFFAVQPGESFHDVEEVYAADASDSDPDAARVRLAISGWFHIPQIGEDGYEEGLQDEMVERSSLAQLQGKEDAFDVPKPNWQPVREIGSSEDLDNDLSEQDLDFLLRFMNPNYLVPDTLEELSNMFLEESSLRLASFLTPKYETALRTSIIQADGSSSSHASWTIARPPHKYRFLFQQSGTPKTEAGQIQQLNELLNDLLPSLPFNKWLGLATGLELTECNSIARRFRRGLDYTLATEYDQEEPQLELCLGLTPTDGWGNDEVESENGAENGHLDQTLNISAQESETSKGGYEVYMAADDETENENGVDNLQSSHTGAGKRKKADPAIYRASAGDDDDGVLFSMPASWNTLSIVLRDQGVLKFVKYVSKSAKGDRWDICSEWKVTQDDEDEDENEPR